MSHVLCDQVLGVTRIHNRHLRVRFEQSIKQADAQACRKSANDGSMYRPEHSREGLDYLFVGEHPALPGGGGGLWLPGVGWTTLLVVMRSLP